MPYLGIILAMEMNVMHKHIFLGQLEANPKLLSWLFDDPSLYGKSPLALDDARYEAYQDFYNALYLDIYGDNDK